VPERAIEFVRRNPDKVQFWDQEALNATLVHQWIELPATWNMQNETQWSPVPQQGKITEPAIVHFITADKPWQWSNKHHFKFEYHQYRLKTPWSQYKQEGKPSLSQKPYRFIKALVRRLLPASLRGWLRSWQS
jgi:lipopolysaccharide biosynthesis glycosyltransferase